MRNIGDTDDPFYRYQRPETMIHTNTKKRTTTILNIVSICSSINRDIDSLKRYLNRYHKTQIKKDGEQLILKGCIPNHVIEESIDTYIQRFVLCKNCGNPETEMKDNKLSCLACGKVSKPI